VRVFIQADALEKLAVRSWRSGQGVVEASGGGAVQGRRAHVVLLWKLAVGWEWQNGHAVSVQSRRGASVRRWGEWLNRQGSRGACASRVLGLSLARVHEREGQGEGVRSV
jgi:hypothetical protein